MSDNKLRPLTKANNSYTTLDKYKGFLVNLHKQSGINNYLIIMWVVVTNVIFLSKE